MKLRQCSIPGCYEIFPVIVTDARGSFVKTFHFDFFSKQGLETTWKEEYHSVSRKGALRGLHFQTPPHDHAKLVYCVCGQAFDAVVDLRVGSPTYGKYAVFDLNDKTANMLYIPSGLAHGFYALSERVTMVYKVTASYMPANDSGILWSSAGIPWPDADPILSERDRGFPPFSSFISPFVGKD